MPLNPTYYVVFFVTFSNRQIIIYTSIQI